MLKRVRRLILGPESSVTSDLTNYIPPSELLPFDLPIF